MRSRGIMTILCIGVLALCGCANTEKEEVVQKRPIVADSVEEEKPESVQKPTKDIVAFEKRVADYTGKQENFTYAEMQKVAMNLDREPYTDTTEVEDLDSQTLLVNKYNHLPMDYVPQDLIGVTSSGENGTVKMRKEAGNAFEKLVAWGKKNGIDISACSAFRDANYQANLWNGGKAQGGIEYADKWWTRAGYSEHQTGLAVDIRLFNDRSDLDAVRNYPNEYQNLLKNMANFGFILRYPDGKKGITLIEPESWHLRYVGIDVAKEIYEKGITFEQYKADEYLENLYKDFPEELARG